MKPEALEVTPTGVVLFDFGTSQLRAFAGSGSEIFAVGRKGAGPGEFVAPTDVSVSRDGRIFVLDAGAGRISQFSGTGKFEQLIAVDRQLHRLTVLPSGGFLAVPLSGPTAIRYSPDGRIDASVAAPSAIADLSPLVRESRLISMGRDVIQLFNWSTSAHRIVPHPTITLEKFELIDERRFPPIRTYKVGSAVVSRVDPKGERVVRSATSVADTLFVLDVKMVGGARYIDQYTLPDMTYRKSRIAPREIKQFVIRRDTLIGLVDDPVPALVCWLWKPSVGK
jgi:hypothetical protein